MFWLKSHWNHIVKSQSTLQLSFPIYFPDQDQIGYYSYSVNLKIMQKIRKNTSNYTLYAVQFLGRNSKGIKRYDFLKEMDNNAPKWTGCLFQRFLWMFWAHSWPVCLSFIINQILKWIKSKKIKRNIKSIKDSSNFY